MGTYLVTGGAGFIGSNLVQLLLQHGHRVHVLDALTYASNPQLRLDHGTNPHFAFTHGSIGDPQALAQAFACAPDGVFHLAAESHVDRSIDDPEIFVQTNVVGTYRLLEASLRYWQQLPSASQAAFRLLHVSTDEVYGSLGPEGRFTADSPYDPSSPYSATKAASDHMVRAYHRTYGLPVIVTNCSNNYGPYQFPEKLIPHMILCCLQDLPLPVYGSGEHRRDWLHVHDHCRGLLAAMSHGHSGATYLFGSGREVQTLEIVQRICAAMDQHKPRADGLSHASRITHVADRPGHDWRCVIDATQSTRQLQWTPHVTLESGLPEAIGWYLAHAAWIDSARAQGYRPARQGLR